MSALNAALCRRGIILWLAAVLLLASRSTHSAPVYDQDTTQIAEYEYGATVGCYFNYQRYQEGDRIMTSEPCLNCTCHNRMLMCYLKVCPFTKAIGQDCTVEKRPDQCCPVITCPEVPVQLLTSTTSAPESTEVGFHDNYGCHVDERFYADGAMLPLDHHNPCELCYCIRNRTTCVMQECTLRVAGCKPVYQPGVCCPIKYNCEYDEEPSTTVGPTPGLIMTTTLPPGVLPQCYYEDKVYEDGDLIYSTQPCQHCYCFRGEIACAVQNCGTPMQEHGKNCTALPPPEGECCPTTYKCEEGITSELPLDEMTEFPSIEDQQQKDEHSQETIPPGIDNIIPQDKEEEENIEGIIEHITRGYTPSTESKEQPATLSTGEIETTTVEKESIPPHEHITETSPPDITSEKAEAVEVPSEIETEKPEISTTIQEVEENLVTKTPTAEIPEVSSIAQGLQPEEILPTEQISEEHVSTEKEPTPAIIERGPSSETTQTEIPIKEEETTSPHEELSTQTQEEITEIEKTTEEEHISVTKAPEIPEISTEIIEKTTLPIEEPGISVVSESISEQPKADKGEPETTPGEPLTTETESPKEEIVTVAHEISSTEQIATEKEISHPTVTAVTEEVQSTEISGSTEQSVEEQKPITSEEQRPEETTSEHAIIEEQATVGAKKEDAGLTESSVMSEEPTKESHTEEVSTPEIPPQGPTGIPIPERSPEQKAEDGVYHVPEDHGVTHPELSPDNLVTESPQKLTTYFPQEQEITLTPSEETVKPIATEGTESVEAATEINVSTQGKPEITTISEETKTESTPAVTEVQAITESSTTIAQEVPGEKAPEKSTEESGEKGEKEVQPKKEEEIEMQPPIATKPEIVSETPISIPTEHTTVPSDLEKEHTTEGELVTTIIPSAEQSTHVPQVEEKETEIIPVEKEEPITEKPVEERVTEHPIAIPDITSEKEKELQTEEPVLKEEQTTEAIKTIEDKFTTQKPAVKEGITEQPEQYSTKKEVVTESHIPEEIEDTKGASTESVEQQTTMMTEKESSEETVESKPTEVTSIDQTELPDKHPIEPSEIEKGDEEKISVPVSTEEIQTEIPIKTETAETMVGTEKIQTEPSISEEHIPSQPSIPSDRKEDQESIEPELHEEQTQKPEKEITEEPLKPTIPFEEEISHIPSLEGAITGPAKDSTTESIAEAVTPEQPEITSEQSEKVTTELGQEEQTQESITEEQPEIYERKETETSSPATHEESSTTHKIPEGPVEGEKEVDVNKTIVTTESESTTIPVLVSEVSTELPGFEESTKHEIPIEKEITPTTEIEQPGLEESTQPSIKEETPIKETESPAEISTGITPETPKVSITEQPQIPEEEIVQKIGTEIPDREEKEKYSTVIPTETPELTTEILPKEVPQYITTSIPEETSVEGESTSEIVPRPSGIPGEGNCLVEGQSYSNNSAVPPANACQTSCRCVSSIVQCELVQCPAPPVHLSNCMPIHTNEDSCCPMYACDSAPTGVDLESGSHVIEPKIPETGIESQKTVSPTEISTEAATESSTLAGEISTPESRPVEITVPSVTLSEEEIATERQKTTLEPVYKQPTTGGQPFEQYPEEHTSSPVLETSQESTSHVPEEHTVPPIVPEEATEGQVSEGVTESAISTEQPQEETGEKQSTVSGEIITSTLVPIEQGPQGTEEIVTVSVTEEKETSIPVEVEEISKPAEKGEEITTIAADKGEETTSIEQEKPTEEKEEQSTLKPIEKIEKKPEEEKVPLKPTSEEPITTEEHEISTTPEEIVTEKQEIPEQQKTVKPEYETTSVPEIQSTTEHKVSSENETGYKEEKEPETVTLTETVQTKEPESQTKLPGITPSETETQKPILSETESTTLIHDYTISEEAITKEFTTVKPMEVSTEETTKIELEISTQAPAIEKEHIIPVEAEIPGKETTKLVEESTPKVSLEETTESAEKETTEYIEKHTESSVTENEEELLVTKLPEEKPSETESPISTEEPTKIIGIDKTTEAEAEHEQPIGTSEKIPEVISEIESHTSELPVKEDTASEVSTEKELGEQSTTPIIKETEPGEVETKQPIIPEAETPATEKEYITVSTEEQTPKSEYPVEEQTVSSSTSEEEIKEGGVSTEEVTLVTSQEEQTTESIKPETQLPGLAEDQSVIPDIKKDEEQKPEIGITEKPSSEEPITEPTEAGEKEIEEAVKEETTTPAITIEEHTKQEEIPELVVKIQGPMETTISTEQKPEEEGQVTKVSLLEHTVSEEATTITGLTPEEQPVSVKTEEKQSTIEPEYHTTLSTIEEEVSKPATEISEVEKPSPEEETTTTESTEKPEEPVTILEVSSTEKPEEIPSETEKPAKPEQETESSEKSETTTKAIESAATKETLPEEVIPVEVTPKVEEKPTEVSTIKEEAYSTEPTYSTEITSIHEEEQTSITKLQPTERPLPSEEETSEGEIQPSKPGEDETHPTVSEESHPDITEEPQFTTEHASEAPITIKTEVEGPVKVSSVKPTELPEETATLGTIIPEEPEYQIPIKSEESEQSETPEEPVIKTQPVSTELPTGEITEEIPEEELHPHEGEEHPHFDHFPAATAKPEIDYNFPEQRPVTTLAPHIPEYPDQTGISGEDSHLPIPAGYPNPDDDYGEDDYGGPGTCRYGGKVYVSAQQIPRDDPCDFCFCFRSDIICLQQSCPPPIPGCHEEPISGFCCPRYECPVSMATALNLTTTTTTTTTTLPPHFHAHAYKGAARRSGCQVRGQAYRVGEVIKSASGPCLRCICGGDGNMNCDPRVCSPEPMLRQMIAATTDAKRRR
ncbi:titin [Monomorium pharaonis]|uniref:titin n=1 Tax=Monomorium pharaonis TaxID=307658 RepID=UPI00063EECCC|nr:titin [Monomorium pharaonis]XP_028049622.1 titin [Monomorium pharaonis]